MRRRRLPSVVPDVTPPEPPGTVTPEHAVGPLPHEVSKAVTGHNSDVHGLTRLERRIADVLATHQRDVWADSRGSQVWVEYGDCSNTGEDGWEGDTPSFLAHQAIYVGLCVGEILADVWIAIHTRRFDHENGQVAGPDSFYAGMMTAEREVLRVAAEHGIGEQDIYRYYTETVPLGKGAPTAWTGDVAQDVTADVYIEPRPSDG